MKLVVVLSSLSIVDDDERSFTDDNCYIHHVRPNDYNCDLLLIVTEITSSELDPNSTTSSDEAETYIMPVDKKILTTYVPYFDSLLSEDNNWFFYTSTDGQESQTKPAIEIKIKKHEEFADFIKAIYGENLDLDEYNCVDFLYVIDFLSVEFCKKDFENFVKENLTFANTIELLKINKLEDEVGEFYKKNKEFTIFVLKE